MNEKRLELAEKLIFTLLTNINGLHEGNRTTVGSGIIDMSSIMHVMIKTCISLSVQMLYMSEEHAGPVPDGHIDEAIDLVRSAYKAAIEIDVDKFVDEVVEKINKEKI